MTRRKKLRRLFTKLGADAMLVTNVTNVTYLTGFTGDDSYLLLTRDKSILLSDPRYADQIGEQCDGLEVEIRAPGTSILGMVKKVVSRLKIARLGIEADSMTVEIHARCAELLPAVTLVTTSGLVAELRQIKDSGEIREIRAAVRLAERAFGVIRASLRGDQTERHVAFEMERQIRVFGGAGCSFSPIVAVGPRSALPHAIPTDRQIGDGDFVLIDWGAVGRLYMSDLTRLLVTGRISPKLERIYGVVLRAQQQAIASIGPGIRMSEVDQVARGVIENAGHGKRFGHGLGHGIGLEIHEAPRLARNQNDLLRAGMVVTVEPGVYLPGWGGVRIEDDVLVTRTGHEVLSRVPKQLSDCVVG